MHARSLPLARVIMSFLIFLRIVHVFDKRGGWSEWNVILEYTIAVISCFIFLNFIYYYFYFNKKNDVFVLFLFSPPRWETVQFLLSCEITMLNEEIRYNIHSMFFI